MQVKGRLTSTDEFGQIIDQARHQRRRLDPAARRGPDRAGRAGLRRPTPICGKKRRVALAITQLPGSNALTTAKAVKDELAEVAKGFPPGMTYSIDYDPTIYIRGSIVEVQHTLVEAMVLVALVVLIFLQSWRAAIIPIIAIPISLIGSMAVLAGVRLFAEQPVALRPRARHRHRRGRRHRRHREYRAL